MRRSSPVPVQPLNGGPAGTVVTSTAARMAMMASTAMFSINVQPAWREPQTRVGDGREKAQRAQENPPFLPGTRADEACTRLVFIVKVEYRVRGRRPAFAVAV